MLDNQANCVPLRARPICHGSPDWLYLAAEDAAERNYNRLIHVHHRQRIVLFQYSRHRTSCDTYDSNANQVELPPCLECHAARQSRNRLIHVRLLLRTDLSLGDRCRISYDTYDSNANQSEHSPCLRCHTAEGNYSRLLHDRLLPHTVPCRDNRRRTFHDICCSNANQFVPASHPPWIFLEIRSCHIGLAPYSSRPI